MNYTTLSRPEPAHVGGTSLPLMGRVAALGRQALAELGGVAHNQQFDARTSTPPSVPPHRGEGGAGTAILEGVHS